MLCGFVGASKTQLCSSHEKKKKFGTLTELAIVLGLAMRTQKKHHRAYTYAFSYASNIYQIAVVSSRECHNAITFLWGPIACPRFHNDMMELDLRSFYVKIDIGG
jgi:hypothetical protein